jgi:hypothetical protein
MRKYVFSRGGLAASIALLAVGAVSATQLTQYVPNPVFAFTGTSVTYIRGGAQDDVNKEPAQPKVTHVSTPPAVRAIYMSQCAATSADFRSNLLALIKDTELNAIVIDVKDYTGTVGFSTIGTEGVGGKGCVAGDLPEFIKTLHEKNIYVIARITVFQDPLYTSRHPHLAVQSKSNPGTPWKDYKGLSFVDIGAREFWDYIVALSNESFNMGFDELNYDYIRYPSDGPMRDVHFTHSDYSNRGAELEQFFRYLSQKVKKADAYGRVPVLSADLFGMTTTNTDDLTIGQVLERTTPYFDYIAPMVYPSHYPPRFNGYPDPNKEVYGVVKFSMDAAVRRVTATSTPVAGLAYEPIIECTPAPAAPPGAAGAGEEIETCTPTGMYKKPSRDANVLRPWLQDFDYGGDYGPLEVRAQIQAAYDAGLNSWMLWDPSNRYTREALKPAASGE